MPMVNGIKYPYTESGKRCAAAAASEIELFPLAHRATVRGCASTKLENSTLENPSFFSANENCIGVIYKSPTQPTETK